MQEAVSKQIPAATVRDPPPVVIVLAFALVAAFGPRSRSMNNRLEKKDFEAEQRNVTADTNNKREAAEEGIPKFQPPCSHSRFPSNRDPAPERRQCRKPGASASASADTLALSLILPFGEGCR